MVEILLWLWGAWCVGNLLCMALVVPNVPSYTGFRIVMPADLIVTLDTAEWEAILVHELGHRHHKHAWKNYLSLCFFRIPDKNKRLAQEFEADDYAYKRGYGAALARALRKLASDPSTVHRAARLEMRKE